MMSKIKSFLFDESKIRCAFARVREDLDRSRKDNEALKANLNEWIRYLDSQNKELLARIEKLEHVKEIES